MSKEKIRVGVIGLTPGYHWAAISHIPALIHLNEIYSIVGVANRTAESSANAASAFGIPNAFSNVNDLINCQDIDLVVVTVKVPHHKELVSAALNAGKHVYCEWPLGVELNEARELSALAERKNLVAVVGTQARVSIETEYLRELLAGGYVGRVVSTTIIGSGGHWSSETTSDYKYLFDKFNGATMQSIPMAHTLAAMREVLGEFKNLSARFVRNVDSVRVVDEGGSILSTTPNQIMIHGELAGGAAASIHYRGGSSRGTNFLWEINGEEGDIQITANSGHFQFEKLVIQGARGTNRTLAPLVPPRDQYNGWPEDPTVRNVARIYRRLADDINNGSNSAPAFRDAVILHELVEKIERSAEYLNSVNV